RPVFGSLGRASSATGVIFTTKVASSSLKDTLGISKEVLHVKITRNIGKANMKLNYFIGDIEIDSETYDVIINGELIKSNYIE
ncbi:urease subunit alpha, partial [Aliarcobacter butzleri]